MAITYPATLDALTNPSGTDNLNSPDHAGQHSDSNDIHEAMQAKVGVDSSTVITSIDYKINNMNGENLIQHSAFWDINDDDLPVMWDLKLTPTLVIATDTLFPSRGGKQVTITGAGAGFEGIQISAGTSNWLKVLPSTVYTFSFDYKSTSGNLYVDVKSYNGAAAGTGHVAAGTTSASAVRQSYTFTTDATADNLRIQLSAQSDGNVQILSHPKLEQGSIATPYVLTESVEQANIIQYYKPYARAYPASDQDDITDATWVQVVLGTEDFDTGADFASNQFTVPVTGFYEIDGCVFFEATDAVADKQYGGSIYVDPLGAGSDAAICYDWQYPSLSAKAVTCRPRIMKKLNATDEVNLWAFADTGGATQDIESGSVNTSLSVRLVKLDV